MISTLHPRMSASRPWEPNRLVDTGHEDAAPQVAITYRCAAGAHDFTVPFAAEDDVTIPDVWECRQHGVDSDRTGIRKPKKKIKAPRTHWDMLRERRSIPELEVLLDERLADLARCRRAGVQPRLAPRGTASGRQYT